MISLSIHGMEQVERRLDALAVAAGVGMQDVTHDVMRLALQNAVKLTYPKRGKDGRDAVARDINKVFEPIPTPQRKRTWTHSTVPGVVFVKTNNGAVIKVPEYNFRPKASESQIRKTHEGERQSRGKVGRSAAKNPKYIKRADLRRYIAKRKKRVGRLKAGWMPALEHYARLARNEPKGVPAFVRNQQSKEGSFSGRIGRGGIGYLEAHNEVPYMRQSNHDWIINKVDAIGQRDLDAHVDKMIHGKGGLVERFNQGRRMAA